jgi:hypothetical protein
MQSKRSLIVGAGLGTLALLAAAPPLEAKQSQDDVTQQEIQALRDQINALQKRLDAQTAAEQQTKTAADAAAAQAAAASAAAAALPAQVKSQVQTAVDAAKPKTDKIYVKGVAITLGGFVEAATVYRQHDTNNDISTAFNSIPLASNSVAQTNQLVETPRQSRFSALVQGDPNAVTHLQFYTEMDLQGAAQTANSKESNSYNPRLRQMFGAVDWDNLGLHFLAGQAWSLVTMTKDGLTQNTEAYPPTVDGQYMPGFVWARQPQIRLTKDFDRLVWVGVSLENPQTTFYTGANALPKDVNLTYQAAGTGLGFNSANNYSLNRLPDAVGKVAVDPMFMDRHIHLEAYGLYQSFYERLDYANVSKSGGGFGGGVFVPVVPDFLDFQVAGLAGKGIGRYGSGQLTEVTFDPAGYIQPIHEVIAMGGLTLHAAPWLDLYVFAGEDKESAQAYDLTTATGTVAYGYGNPLYSNTGCVSETATGGCVANERLAEQVTGGFWNKPYVGSYGMVRWGVQFSHTEFVAFTGKGGTPEAIQNMVFLSFRYYPFSH